MKDVSGLEANVKEMLLADDPHKCIALEELVARIGDAADQISDYELRLERDTAELREKINVVLAREAAEKQ